MKANAVHAVTLSDFTRLERAFDRIAHLGPSEYQGWSGYAVSGEKAAQAHDLEGCRRACKGCHETYRAAYRSEHRLRPLP